MHDLCTHDTLSTAVIDRISSIRDVEDLIVVVCNGQSRATPFVSNYRNILWQRLTC